jgi:hypothetical protein
MKMTVEIEFDETSVMWLRADDIAECLSKNYRGSKFSVKEVYHPRPSERIRQSRRKYADCPRCDRRIALRRNGEFYKHSCRPGYYYL